ncbi:MAG: hypothetical protein ACHQ51_00820 [Elusimicrobiota bacterium]
MIRRFILTALTFLFLFWLFWPRAWLPSGALTIARLEVLSPNTDMIADARDFASGDAAILLLAPDQEAFAAGRVFRSAGIPFMTTRDTGEAFTHRLVIIPAGDHGMRLSARERARLGAYVAGGGTLIMQVLGPVQWGDLTGLESISPSRGRRRLIFVPAADDGFRYLNLPELQEVRLASNAIGDGVWSAALKPRPRVADVLAHFDDPRDAAVLRRRVGLGRVYSLGFDLRDLFVRPQAARHFDAGTSPTEPYQPGADVWPLIIRAWYEGAVPEWARLRSLPGEDSGLVALTHSLESGDSPAAAADLARWENARGVRSTWFVQTNDSDGGQPGPFYDATLAAVVRGIAALGHELAAHTVSHPASFLTLPEGSGLELRRTYRPDTDSGSLWDASLMGEIRVPREILEADVPGAKITGFRSPFHQYPDILDEALAASGYAWDSSLTAAQTLTHRPFLLTRQRTMLRESRIVELPMTLQDEVPSRHAPPDAADVLRLLGQVSGEEGLFVWHTRPTQENRALEAAVLAALPRGTGLLTMGETARWWTAREKTRFSLEHGPSPRERILRMSLPPEADGARVSFELFAPIRSCFSDTPGLSYSCMGRIVTLYGTAGARDAALSLQFEKLDAAEPPGVPRP